MLHHYFEVQARRRPDHPAIEFAGETLTYEELDHDANRMANYLVSKGVEPGALVGIFLKKSPRLYAAILGILKAGGGYVPIDPRSPLERIEAIAEDAQLRFIITEDVLAEQIEGKIETPLLHLDREQRALAEQPSRHVLRTDADISNKSLSYVIFTSGSTGRPKGVMIEHRNVVAFVKSLQTVYKVTADDRVYQGFSTAFDASVEEIWAAFSRGGTLIVPTEDIERSPLDVAQFINDTGITYYSTVPTMLAMVDRDLPSVKTLVLGGEACSNELVARWAKPGRRMLNTYGPTEATVVATWSECVAGEPVSIGRALPGYSAYVLDADFNPVRPGESGELFIGGAGVGRGYMNLQQLTEQRFIPNTIEPEHRDRLYRTYDHVRLGQDGELFFLGRLDDQVKIRGFRIELSEIESVLIEHPLIKAAAVTVIDRSDTKDLAAFVVCSGTETLPREEIDQLLRRRMPAYMVPQYLDVIDELPMMPSGKVDRKKLPEPQTLLKGQTEIVAPATDLEVRIAAAWSETFRLAKISVTDDFFLDLGGHSLLASRCASLLREQISGIQLSVRDFYEHRTIRRLSAALKPRLDASKRDAAVKDNTGAGAFSSVHPLMRWTTVALQAVSVAAYYTVIAAPLAYVVLMLTAVIDGRMDWVQAAQISTVVGFAIWPSMLLLSIALKWIVIGRFKPGRYPLWGSYYFRWWLVTRFQSLSWAEMFSGTPLMSLYWRAMGAKVGRDVSLCTSLCGAFDMVSIGDGTSVGLESQILGYRVEDGYLVIAPVEIGNDCFIGMHCSLGLDTVMSDGARLDDMSLLPDGTAMGRYECRRGSPARLARVVVPERIGRARRTNVCKRFAFGAMHLVLIYAMGYFLMLTALPALVLIAAGLWFYGPLGGIAAAFLAVPVGIVSYTFATIDLMRLLGHSKAGRMPVHSFRYLRHWFESYLLENTKTILQPLYATIYCPSFLRALGAKIGAGSEVSTVAHITPSLLEVGDGSFLADACLVGGQRVYGGVAEIGAVSIGARSFVGNSALVAGGHSVGDNALIGVASTPPSGSLLVPDDTRWLGSPGFELPQTQRNEDFNDAEIFAPTRRARIARTLTDTLRIVLPGLLIAAEGVVLTTYLVMSFRTLPLWIVIAGLPVVATALAAVSVLLTALIKAVFVGRITPTVRPLWSRFIWNNELVNGVFEMNAATAMTPLLGTPFVSTCLRLMGCKIGKWCYLETTLFSEFDLVEIGDRACLNIGSTIQNHLFEDRVFKADRIKIGNGCTIGNMGVILYDTEMHDGANLGPLSVLMKGEVLPAGTRWHGTPCEPVAVKAEKADTSQTQLSTTPRACAQHSSRHVFGSKNAELLPLTA